MKKLYTFLFALSGLLMSVSASGADYKSLVISYADGSTLAINMEKEMTTKVAAGNLTMSCDKGDIVIPVENLKNWVFSTQPGRDDQWASADLLPADAVTIEMTSGEVVLGNLPEQSRVSLVAIDGRVLFTAVASGSCCVPLSGATGVCVLVYNNKSVKIAVK